VGRGSTSSGLAVGGESAAGNEFIKGSVDTVALDMTMKKAPDLILRQSVAGGLDGFADGLRGLRRPTEMARDMRGMRGKVPSGPTEMVRDMRGMRGKVPWADGNGARYA
jgi:hypothetical protein